MKRHRKIYYHFLVFGIVVLAACAKDEEVIEPKHSFTRLYETQDFTDKYQPVSVVQTSDSGYLTLSRTEQWKAHLFKSDEEGITSWVQVVDEPFVHPLPQLYPQDSGYWMFGMNELSQSLEIFSIGATNGALENIRTISSVKYPLAVHKTPDQQWIVLGYNRDTQSSTLHLFSADFVEVWNQSFEIQEDVEEHVVNHIAGIGDPLPFFIGTNGNYIYFNGFYNYSFSLVFANLSNGEYLGVINGYRNKSTVSALYPLGSQQYALAQNNYGDGAILSNVTIQERTIGFGGDLPTLAYNEIDENARVLIKEIDHVGQAIILYGTHTKRRQMVFYAYDKETSELISINYLGQTNPYRLGDFIQTDDGGLAVISETYLAGKFSRLALFKLSKEELAAWF
uniref:Lipoprotein n=1 Tax=Roseihalotalea indica TaxID=2867963 RepID=A0AA49GL83_9BACT|nr:hypothetical protein K4G66_28795 [Tunicatimonas sp. TK19036]